MNDLAEVHQRGLGLHPQVAREGPSVAAGHGRRRSALRADGSLLAHPGLREQTSKVTDVDFR